MQRVSAYCRGELIERQLPPARERVAGHKVAWGKAEAIGTPAYWITQSWMWEAEYPTHYQLGGSLREEVLACLLGGYGIPAEVGLAAYARLREQPEEALQEEEAVLQLLTEPVVVGGRPVRYRFAKQKARYVAAAMQALQHIDTTGGDRDLREALTEIPGVGLKTASWIVRNWRRSDDVAILDIHIVRACIALQLFPSEWRVEQRYRHMEEAFLAFCRATGARASILDSVMWMTMRELPSGMIDSMLQRSTRSGWKSSATIIDSVQPALL